MSVRISYNRTKIVATLGPASSTPEILEEMIKAGADVFRVNFSHGDYSAVEDVVKHIHDLNRKLGTHVSILGDLQGPKLRIGEVENNGVELKEGAKLTFTSEKVMGNADRVFMTYQQFPRDVKPGENVLIDDGKLVLRVDSTNGKDEVVATVLHGGILSSKKGVNLPNTKISLPCLTEKDLKDLEFALKMDFDWIGLSFVRSGADIIELKHIIKELKADSKARVIAKIEACKPVIIATQMMESMITNITPSRAEVNDVANSVMDGADAVMLSGETSVGKHPHKVVEAMSKIIAQVEEEHSLYYSERPPIFKDPSRFISDNLCYSATQLAKQVNASAIITMTHSGYTAFRVSGYRPRANVFVFTSNYNILTQLNLLWGVRCFYYDKNISTDHTIADIKFILKKNGLISAGDYIINIASIPLSEKGMTNMVKLTEVE